MNTLNSFISNTQEPLSKLKQIIHTNCPNSNYILKIAYNQAIRQKVITEDNNKFTENDIKLILTYKNPEELLSMFNLCNSSSSYFDYALII